MSLMWGTAAQAQYNPADPPEPGVNFTLTTRCVPENAAWNLTPKGSHAFGSSVYVYVSRNTGFKFIQWEDEEGNVISTDQEFSYTMPSRNVTLTARFVYDPDSPVEPSTPEFKTVSEITFITNPVDAGYFYQQSQGSWRDSYSDEFEVGSAHDFQAYSHEYYRFVNWTRGGVVIGTDEVLNYTVPQGDHTLVANFEYDPTNPVEPGGQRPLRQLKVQTNPAEAGYVHFYHDYYSVYDAMVEEGSTKSIYSEAYAYYTFVNWTDDEGNVVSDEPIFDFQMPNHKITLTANYTYNYDPANPEEPGTPNPDGSIAENMVMWPRFGMFDNTHVQILCETPGATIHYTLDGTNPTAASPVYTEPVYVSSNLLVKAIAYKEGMEDSPVVSYQVTAYKTGAPIFTFENRLLKISSETPDAIIRYTTDFTDPNEESTVYTAPFEPEENCRIKAYASKEGLTDSPISIYVFRRAEHSIPAPTFSMNEDGKLVIIPAVSDGETRYTIDGTDPDATSTLYTEPLTLDGNFTVKAYTTHVNFYDSPVGEYVIDGYKVEIPKYEYKDLALTLATVTPGATVRYTTDGSVPTEESAAYTAPLRLTEDCKVVARGFKANYEPSDTISYTFVFEDHQVATPVLTYDPEARAIIMTCETDNAEIRYTLDGSEPTATSGEVYTTPISASAYDIITGGVNIIARAFRNDLFDSEQEDLQDLQSLSIDMWHSWTNWDASAEINDSDDIELEDNVGKILDIEKVILGNGGVFGRLFVDLTGYAGIYGKGTPGMPIRFIFNRPDMEGGDAPFTECNPTFDENGEFTFLFSELTATEIEEFGAAYPYVHLNTIKMPWSFPEGIDQGMVTKLNYIQNDQVTPTPTGSFSDRKVILSCPDANASIFYTTDGTVPTLSSTLYTVPISLTSDCNVKFIAKSSGYFVSSLASFEFKHADHQVAAPMLTYDPMALTVTMRCDTVNAEIRYTIDGKTPTAETGIKYEGPVAVVGNHTYTARAFRSDLFDSEIATVVVDDQKVARPGVKHSLETMKVTMTCATPGAAIRYTTDGSVPTSTTGTLYTEPLDITGNITYTVRAFLADFIDSDINVYEVDGMKLPTPTAAYGRHAVTLSCEEEGVELHYTLDGSDPTAQSTLYQEPIPMTGDCLVRFIAIKAGYNDSEANSYRFTLSQWQEEAPSISKDYRNRRIVVDCSSAAGIRVMIDGTESICGSHETLEVNEGMSRLDFTAIAANEDRYDSETLTETLVFHLPPVLTYDGFEGRVNAAPGDPAPEGAERHFRLDGQEYSDVRDIVYPIGGFHYVTAHIESDHAFRSGTSDMEIEFYNTGTEAGAINGYTLEDAFRVWDDRLDEFKYLRLTGELNRGDLEFVASLPELKTLTIDTWSKIDDCGSVFADSRIETLNTYFLSEGMLSGMPRLTTLIWSHADESLPAGRLTEAGNPNLLLWVNDRELAPEDAINVVEYDSPYYGDPADPSIYVDVNGRADKISLVVGHPFNVHKEISAGEVTLTKEFSLPTQIGKCAGWETLTVPFDVESIIHEDAGEIVPFKLWTGREHLSKPFWLYCATDTTATGWKEATAIEAGVPYIISMPNNDEYVNGYSLPGKVTFGASEVTLTPEGTQPKESAWLGGITFAGTFMPVEETDIRSLNINSASALELPGSAFVGNDETLPFGAYMRGESMPQRIPVFGDWSGVMTPVADAGGIMVETPAPGTIRVSSARACNVAIFTPEGAAIRTLSLRAGDSISVEGLSRGLYICAGVKVMVK